MRCQKLRLADTFVGALAYADDLVLTAPVHAVRKMLAISDAYMLLSILWTLMHKNLSVWLLLIPSSRRMLAPSLSECACF